MNKSFFKAGFSSPKKYVWAGMGLTCAVSLMVANRIPGVVRGFGTLRNDGIIDAALVVPTLTSEQILAFELGDLMAPKEKMSAGPMDVDVPGNLYVPEQSEDYGIFPITIRKNEFGYYPKTSDEVELATYGAQAPFGDLVSKIRNHAPYKEILQLVTFKKFGLTDKRDWSRANRIATDLDKAPQTLGAYRWNRSAGANTDADLVLSFQQTPSQRWMLGGLDTRPQARGNVTGVQGLTGLTKTLFVRVINDAQNNPIAARGYFRTHTPQAPGDFNVENIPPALDGLKLEERKTLRWTDPKVPGWIGVFRAKKSNSMNLFYHLTSPEMSQEVGIKSTEQWVPAFSEEYVLEEPLKDNEELVVVFVGSSEQMRAADSGDDTQVFAPVLESATELRLSRIH
jgi:hypothetical protein